MLIHGIQEREMNISKIEVLRQGALDGTLDIPHFRNKTVDQFLKTDEYGSLGLPSSAIIGVSVAAGLIVMLFIPPMNIMGLIIFLKALRQLLFFILTFIH